MNQSRDQIWISKEMLTHIKAKRRTIERPRRQEEEEEDEEEEEEGEK